jgi:hypothetical protein
VICLVLYAFARLIGVPFEVQGLGGLAVLPWPVVLLLPLAAGVVGALLAGLLRGVRFGGRIVLIVGTAVALLSLISPLAQPAEVLWSTRIWLVVMHVITWLLVVPQIARIVGDSQAGGQLSSVTDIAYDAVGRLKALRSPLATQAVAAGILPGKPAADDPNVLTTVSYDGEGRVSRITRPAPLSCCGRTGERAFRSFSWSGTGPATLSVRQKPAFGNWNRVSIT